MESITFSLKLVGSGLPDEAVIAGTNICNKCDVKPPIYRDIVELLKEAMRTNVQVQACYNSTGQIQKVRLFR